MRYGLRESYQHRIYNCFNEYDPKSTGIVGDKIYPRVSGTLLGRYYQDALEKVFIKALQRAFIMALVEALLVGSWGTIQKGGEV
jgi:hypothetical protein